jgi:hypothetical protein
VIEVDARHGFSGQWPATSVQVTGDS